MVQVDRTLPSEGKDRRFESCWERDAVLAGVGDGPQSLSVNGPIPFRVCPARSPTNRTTVS